MEEDRDLGIIDDNMSFEEKMEFRSEHFRSTTILKSSMNNSKSLAEQAIDRESGKVNFPPDVIKRIYNVFKKDQLEDKLKSAYPIYNKE